MSILSLSEFASLSIQCNEKTESKLDDVDMEDVDRTDTVTKFTRAVPLTFDKEEVLYCDAELFERIKEFPEHAVWKIFLLVLRARVILQLDDSVALSAAGYTSMADLLFMCEEEEVEGMFIPREGINMDKFSSVANFFETHGVLDFDKDWNTMYSFVEDYVAFPFSSGSAALQPGRILEPHLWWALNGLKLDAQGEQVGSRLIECFKQWYGSYVDHATVAFMQYPSGAPPQ